MSLLKDPLEIKVALLRGLATARTPKLHKIHRLFLRKSLGIAWKGHSSLQVTLVGSCVPPAPILCCLVAPGVGSLAGKPKLAMVPLDLAQIQPLHPFYKSGRKTSLAFSRLCHCLLEHKSEQKGTEAVWFCVLSGARFSGIQ